jgi:hypothetical protein
VTLFESESQYREKATIWRVFSLFPLYAALAGDRAWRWFAINIPMDLGTGGFTSDIDILARLYDFPHSQKWLYKTWEVKVSLLCKDGTSRSLKFGKIARTMTQLKAYRDFGSPDVSLLDIYLCEAGFMRHNAFPTPILKDAISAKIAELSGESFGYQLLPFEHDRVGNADVGLRAMSPSGTKLLQTTLNILPSVTSQPREPFSRLVARLDRFFEQTLDQSPEQPPEQPPDQSSNPFNKQIVFCRTCRQLQLIKMKDEHTCPNCQNDLVAQS